MVTADTLGDTTALVTALENGEVDGNRVFYKYDKTSSASALVLGGVSEYSAEELDCPEGGHAQIVIFRPGAEGNTSDTLFLIQLECYINADVSDHFQRHVEFNEVVELMGVMYIEGHRCYDENCTPLEQ